MSISFYVLHTLLLLAFLNYIECALFLHITQSKNDTLKDVRDTITEEFGSNITLKCEILYNPEKDHVNDHLLWVKSNDNFRFTTENELRLLSRQTHKLFQFIRNGEINEAILHFGNFSREHEGFYACVSLKYKLFRVVEIKEDNFEKVITRLLETVSNRTLNTQIMQNNFHFCNQNMFTCTLSTLCINYHYVCDGKKDCSDGSDEDWKMCNGDPCEGKIHCDDGRCIPSDWCCDYRYDLNCTIKIRHSCCPPILLDDEYVRNEEIIKNNTAKNTSTRYLFITICMISTFLSVLLLILILSKICGFASKYSYDFGSRGGSMFGLSRQRPILLDGTVVTQYSRRPPRRECQHTECTIRRDFLRSYSCSYRPNMAASSPLRGDALDPLLNRDSTYGNLVDRPPSYAEAVKVSTSGFGSNLKDFRDTRYVSVSNTPPPPYCSTEALQEVSINQN